MKKLLICIVSALILLTGTVSPVSATVQTADPAVGQEETVYVQETSVTKTKLVATGKLRIDWKKSPDASGYEVYRRTSGGKWKKIATVQGASQTYCYDSKVSAKKTYYYTVKAYARSEGETVYALFDEKGKKARYPSVTVNPKAGNFKKGSVYGPYISAKQLSQVKKAVHSFCKNYITSDMTQVEKVMTAQLYMASTCAYAPDYSKNGANSAWGALVYKNKSGYHEAQCSGFARGFKALCDGMGVPCRYVHANKKSFNPSHQWVEVKIGKKWYIIDPQGNASSGGFYFFLCSGTSYTKMSGMTWDKKSYPALSKKDYPYTKIEKAWNGYKIQQVLKKLWN